MTWSPEQYLKFEYERTRPARDLLQGVPDTSVKRAADLGCGPGNSTELIAAHFPDAEIVGVDNSPEMIAAARHRLPDTRFELSAIQDWDEPGPWDLLYANAALQWVPNHEHLLPSLALRLSTGGSLAVQMPDNLQEPSHSAMRKVAQQEPFANKLGEALKLRTVLPGADWYYRLLKPLCSRVDIWRTVYFYVLAGGLDGIAEWVKGTGLRPFLKPLTGIEQEHFLSAYRDELAEAYSPLADGTVLLPFPRFFIVATR